GARVQMVADGRQPGHPGPENAAARREHQGSADGGLAESVVLGRHPSSVLGRALSRGRNRGWLLPLLRGNSGSGSVGGGRRCRGGGPSRCAGRGASTTIFS